MDTSMQIELWQLIVAVSSLVVTLPGSIIPLLRWWKKRKDKKIPCKALKERTLEILGEVKGQLVYDGLIKKFDTSDRPLSYRTSMKYNVVISRELEGAKMEGAGMLGEPLLHGKYYHFKADLSYDRVCGRTPEMLVIEVIMNRDRLADSARRQCVVYREVIEVNDDDSSWIGHLRNSISSTQDNQERLNFINKLLLMKFSIGGNPALISEVQPTAFGYNLLYQVPAVNWEEPVKHSFSCISVFPRKRTSFPFVVVEPTQRAQVHLDFSQSKVRNANHFRAFFVGANPDNPKVDFNQRDNILDIASINDEWLFEGDGALVYWSE